MDRDRQVSQRAAPGLLRQRSLDEPESLPAVRLRTVRQHPLVFRKMLSGADPGAEAGDLVSVELPDGERLGYGLYNPRAELAVRMLAPGGSRPDRAWWRGRLAESVSLRHDLLRLPEQTTAYRVVHAEADGLSGLMIDRYGEVLSAEVFSVGMYQRAHALLDELAAQLQTRHWVLQVAPQTHGQEGFLAEPETSADCPKHVVIEEYGTQFQVQFAGGHKTGYFCDHRENRRRLAELARDRTVLDLCCYSGGFSVQALHKGAAKEATGVDLDEAALAVARENGRLNRVKGARWVQADAFAYMRDMLQNGRRYDVVVLDPPKLIRSRAELETGTRKHADLNRLAVQLVSPGGLLLTCSCSGLLGDDEFLQLVHHAAGNPPPLGLDLHRRRVQVLAQTGAAADHPVSRECPETEYLKAVWLRVL